MLLNNPKNTTYNAYQRQVAKLYLQQPNYKAPTYWNKQKPLLYTFPSGNKAYYNPFEKKFQLTDQVTVPKYTFTDAMALAPRGYTGIFGRSPSKQTLGLVGENYQQNFALARLRAGLNVPELVINEDAPYKTLQNIAAASPITKQKYNQLLGLYTSYNDKYGVAGYQERYGHTPTVGSKYGILFNTNNQKIRQEDVLATEQNNLASAAVKVGKMLIDEGTKQNNDSLKALGLQYTGLAEYKLGSNRAKPDVEKIKEMRSRLHDIQTMSPRITEALGGSQDTSIGHRIVTGIAGATLGMMAGAGAAGAIAGYASSEEGSKQVDQALSYMNGLSNSDVLKSRDTYWKNNAPSFAQWGPVGFGLNFWRGVARMGLGMPAGTVMAMDEAYKAGEETYKWKTNDNYTWGKDVDFQLGDALWKDYAERFYDPFAYDSKGKGQHFWEGLNDMKSWDTLGNKINSDPVAYTLDIVSLAPVIGWAAKAGALAGTTARFARFGGRAGIVAEDVARLRAAKARAASGAFDEYTPEAISNARDLLNTLENKPYLIDSVDEATLKEAGKIVTEANARDELTQIQAKFDQAPSGRAFRRTVRAAINGDKLAQDELSRWKAMGYEFNGADKMWTIRASAVFEPRTKVLEKPESVIEASPDAIYRLPASPLMRAAKEGFFWVGRGIDAATINASTKGGIIGRVGVKLLDMPLLSYRYNYTKAIRMENAYAWGDTATEMSRAANLLKINAETDLPGPMRRAVEAQLMGGEGTRPLQYPAIQRQQIQDKIAELPRDPATGEVIAAAKGDLALLERKLSDLMDNTINDVIEASKSYDQMFDENLADIRMRLADSTYKADDKILDQAVALYRRMDRQDQAIHSRIMHEDTTPTTLEHLKMLYTEAMDGLRLSPRRLFGDSGRKGRIGRFTNRVLRVNTNFLLLRMAGKDRNATLALAQKADETGTVFDSIADPVLRAERENQMIEAVDALGRDGAFIDGLGSYGAPGRHILIKADMDVGKDFVAFHIPTLRHTMENGKIYNGRIVDTSETFVLPKVFFAARKKGRGAPVIETAEYARNLLYEGALNAMSSVYPKARFYSEKLNDTGLRGVRSNEQMIANEHRVAQTGLRQHALSRVIQSQVNYLRSRVERDLRGLAESQAVIVPAAEVTGKTAAQSGYHIMSNVRVFENINEALDFARLRGVGQKAEDAFAQFTNGDLKPVGTISDVTEGMGYLMIDGKPRFVVRGGTHDWLLEATQEDITKHSTTSAWIEREFSDPTEIPKDGYVLAIPNRTFRNLAEMTIESDTLSARLLNSTGVKGWGNLFKWFVLNANPGFITNNVIGGLTMMMMYNPHVSARLLSTAIQKIARESIVKRVNNDWFTAQLAHFKNESEAVGRTIKYENEHNIYKQDSGLQGSVEGVPWYKKYVWHGGYTTISAWEEMMRRNVAMQFLRNDPGFQAFMRGPEVKKYMDENIDWNGNVRSPEEPITAFEAATDLLLDRGSPHFNAELKHRMRYITNTISGNYHMFNPAEQLMRNVVMPFYSWQRHSATFTYRMFVDKPITTNVAYNLGQQGYLQNAEQGYPDWMMGTMPAPQVIKDMFGITDDDFRLDGNIISPMGTTGDMGRAAIQLLTGADMNKNVFEFTNPYLNELIKSTLGVDPRTGRIDWTRLREQGMSPEGFATMGKDMFTNIFKATYPYKINELLKYQEYEQDALANQYAAIENAPDILKNYDPSKPDDPWRLSVPEMRMTEALDPTQRLFSTLGIKSYRFNPSTLPPEARRDAVGAIVMKYINSADMGSKADKAVKSATEWKRRYDYVMQVWLPAAQAQGMDPAQIQFVLNKIRDERPKTGVAKELTSGYGG